MSASDEVIAAAEQRASALASGDAEKLSGLLHDAFRWTTHTGDSVDKAEYVRRNTEGDTVWHSQALIGARVVAVGDAAVLHARVVDVVGAANGEVETFRMPVTQVWTRTDGGWRCLAGHAGPRLP